MSLVPEIGKLDGKHVDTIERSFKMKRLTYGLAMTMMIIPNSHNVKESI